MSLSTVALAALATTIAPPLDNAKGRRSAGASAQKTSPHTKRQAACSYPAAPASRTTCWQIRVSQGMPHRAHPHGVWHAGISWWSIKMWLRCCLREVNILVIALSQTAPLPPDGYSTFASRLVHASTHQHELHDEKEITAVNPAPAQTRPVQGQSHLQGKSHM